MIQTYPGLSWDVPACRAEEVHNSMGHPGTIWDNPWESWTLQPLSNANLHLPTSSMCNYEGKEKAWSDHSILAQ